jgi:hypothetical protein
VNSIIWLFLSAALGVGSVFIFPVCGAFMQKRIEKAKEEKDSHRRMEVLFVCLTL